MRKILLFPFPVLLIGIGTTLILTAGTASAIPSIKWDMQIHATGAFFQSVGMCKGTTDQTRKVGFAGGQSGSIWRTLDGEIWKQVVQFPSSANWYGVYCFPDAKRVLVVGSSNGDDVLPYGAIITWSFDGGNTWTDRKILPGTQDTTWLQSVDFYNDTHGIILPWVQGAVAVTYYTTNGGTTASDWNIAHPQAFVAWGQSHAIWAFGDVTKTLAWDGYSFGGTYLCSSGNAGKSWNCSPLKQEVMVGSFVSPNDAIGFGDDYNVYSTQDGGTTWTSTSALPKDISNALLRPTDAVWIANSDVVILAGGIEDQYQLGGTVAHSMDRGLTWVESMPQLPSTMFTSLDWVSTSPTTTEVWAVGFNNVSSIILHATVTIG